MFDSYTIINTINRTGYAYCHLGKDDRQFKPRQTLSRNTTEEEVINKISSIQKIVKLLDNITEIQRTIIYYLIDDLNSNEIAEKMKISCKVVNNNIRVIRKKAKRLQN